MRLCAVLIGFLLAGASIAHGQEMRRGRIVTPDDKPLAGATVHVVERDDLGSSRIFAASTTDADGRFSFITLPKQYQLLAKADGYAWSGATVSQPGEDQPAESRIQRPTALRVRLLGPDGEPVSGIRATIALMRAQQFFDFLAVLPDELKQRLAQTTDAQGFCTFEGLPQECIVRVDVLDERFARISHETDITLAPGADSNGGELKLAAAARVSGRVVYGDSGAPAAGIRVAAQGTAHHSGWSEDTTDSDGKYVLKQLSGGVYNIALGLSDELSKRYAAVAHESLEARAGEHLEKKDFTLIAGGLIRGKAVIAGSNKPVAELQLGVYGPAHPKSGGWVQGTRTAADGSYEFRVPPGEQYLYVMMQTPAGLLGPETKEHNITVAGGQVTTVDFIFGEDLTPGVSGTVVDADGRPVANANVSAQFAGGGPFRGQARWAATDAQGRFTLPAVPNGAIVQAVKGSSITIDRNVVDDANRTMKLTIHKDGHGSIRVRVLLPDGKPASGSPVHLMEWELGDGGGTSREQKTDADGVFTFKSLDPIVRYEISAGGSGFTRANAGAMQVVARETAEVLLTVSTVDGFVGGVVVDVNGKPVPDLYLSIGGRGSGRFMTKTDSNGRFRQGGLVPGDVLRIFPQAGSGRLSEPAQVPVGTEDTEILYDPKPFPQRP